MFAVGLPVTSLILLPNAMTSRDRDFGRKYGSGNSKRKKYQKRIEVETQLRGALTKFLKTDKVADDKEQSTKEAEDDAAI